MDLQARTIVGIWAHPDDEVWVSGGLMAAAVRGGSRVVCLHATRGEQGYAPERGKDLAALRSAELSRSLDIVGVAEQRWLDYPDGALCSVPFSSAVTGLVSILDEISPDVVLTFGPDGFTGHPDHRRLSAWVTRAFWEWNRKGASLHYAAVTPQWTDRFVWALNEFDAFWPGYPRATSPADLSFALELADDLLALKLQALVSHASQMDRFFSAFGTGFMAALSRVEAFRAATPQSGGPLAATCEAAVGPAGLASPSRVPAGR